MEREAKAMRVKTRLVQTKKCVSFAKEMKIVAGLKRSDGLTVMCVKVGRTGRVQRRLGGAMSDARAGSV